MYKLSHWSTTYITICNNVKRSWCTYLVVVITEFMDRMPMQLIGLSAGNENILERLLIVNKTNYNTHWWYRGFRLVITKILHVCTVAKPVYCTCVTNFENQPENRCILQKQWMPNINSQRLFLAAFHTHPCLTSGSVWDLLVFTQWAGVEKEGLLVRVVI